MFRNQFEKVKTVCIKKPLKKREQCSVANIQF